MISGHHVRRLSEWAARMAVTFAGVVGVYEPIGLVLSARCVSFMK